MERTSWLAPKAPPIEACAEVIWVDPERLSGTPCFRGTRVPIKNLFDYIEGGDSLDDFLDAFAGVTREQAVKVLELAQTTLLKGVLVSETIA